jgi:hypothetical protein
LDTADTGSAFNGGDHDVTFVTPRCTPGVSDDVVVLTVLLSVSDSGDGVIEVGSALGGVEDTLSVTLEGSGVSFYSDGDWSSGDGSHELRGRVFLDGVDLRYVDKWGSFLLASARLSVSGGVWVGGFTNLTVLGNVVHTV